MALTQEKLKQLFNYNPDTGTFTRLVDVGKKCKAGDVVGCKNSNGYLQVVIEGKHYKLHRLAVLYMNNEMNDGDVDHANGDKTDNRWDNLRCCSRSQNMANAKVQCNNKAGLKGVHFDPKGKKQWIAQISKDNKKIYLGSFETAEEAHIAYVNAATKHHGEYAKV